MDQDSWRPAWIRGSRIEDMVWIGKDVLAWCTGLCIVFFNIIRKSQELRWCINSSTGEGAKCISGHSTLSIFAFSEKILNPRILVCGYPSMGKISECSHGCQSGYLATAFTADEHLVTLGNYPNFPMIIWSWRSGDKLLIVNTAVRDELGQILRISQIGPTVIAQVGRRCGKLFTWELTIFSKTVILKDHEIKLPNEALVHSVDWCPTSIDALLAITDKDGHIFLSNLDGSNVYRIVLSQRCGICLEIELPIVRWFRDGIVLKTTFCQIRFFRKNPNTNAWRKVWYVKSDMKPYILTTPPSRSDSLFYHTFEGYLMQIDLSGNEKNPLIQQFLHYGSSYRFIDFVYPWCHHFATQEQTKTLRFYERYSGTEVSRFNFELSGDVTAQASHPEYPLIFILSTKGELLVVSVKNPDEPCVSFYIRLQETSLDLIRFSPCGRYLAVAEKSSGNCYCISLGKTKPYTVQALIESHKKIADIVIYDAKQGLKVLILQMGAVYFSVGQQLQVYDVPEDQDLISEITNIFDLPGVYRNLWHIPGDPQSLIGSPYLTRQLRVQKVQDFKQIKFVEGVPSGHQVKLANVFTDRQWITSAAADGLIFVRDKTVKRIVATCMTHHRRDFGTVKVIGCSDASMILSLGHDGSIVALKSSPHGGRESEAGVSSKPENLHRVDYSWYEREKEKILFDYGNIDPNIQKLLAPLKEGSSISWNQDETWKDWREKMQIEKENRQYSEQKISILQDFELLKEKVKTLLDSNDSCPEVERLLVAEFDLDKVGREVKLKAGKDEREDTWMKFEHDSSEMEKVSHWIRITFWDTQVVLSQSLFSIFGNKEVTNYTLTLEDPHAQDFLHWAEFCRNSVRTLLEGETFQPWLRYTEKQLREELRKYPMLSEPDKKRRMDTLLEEEDEEMDENILEEQMATEGMTTHCYVEQSPYYYSQMEVYGLWHAMLNNRFLTHDCHKLRFFFNQVFEEVYNMKDREMTIVQKRIERIRHINSELNLMYGLCVPYVPMDPNWRAEEKPESIIRVLDHEVKTKPYISPSQQELLDLQAAEEEKQRQLLLADDFYERALMKMMDGVLEIRWEDIIKIDVPKPDCMLEKKPEDYTAEDILAVKNYEKKVQNLLEDRERYKRILEADYTKVNGLLQEGVQKFNAKLDELFQLKINIEAAINQLNLHYIRGCMRNFYRVKTLEEEDSIKREMKHIEISEVELQDQVKKIENLRGELVEYCESLSNREKAMPRKFQTEFTPLGKNNYKFLEQHYKRRPKTNLKNLHSSNLLDLANCVSSRTRLVYLLPECKEYLKILENFDTQPQLAASIEAQNWEDLIRLRRQKIDVELKLKAKLMEVQNTENTINRLHDRIIECKSRMDGSRKKLGQSRNERLMVEQDTEIQLVLKMGQVELKLKGEISDTENALFIPRQEVESVNDVIHAAGLRKLSSLTRSLKLERITMLKEWGHSCLRKRLHDLREDLHLVCNTTLTKEMQEYLKRKARGWKEEKSAQQLDRDIQATRARWAKLVAKHGERLEEIEREIATNRSKNEALDREIMGMNVARCEMEFSRDLITEAEQCEYMDRKMRMLTKRSHLIRKLQDNYAELLALQTEHELLRLRRYPMIAFRILDHSTEKRNLY